MTANGSRADGGPQRPLRALVVEDAVEIQELVTDLLRSQGLEVRTAGDGEAALTLARAIEPDVVVLDVNLPGMDGVETCRRLRSFTDAYVLMLTARDDEVDKVMGLSVGADDYVTKPFSPRELVARVSVLLRRPRGLAAAARPEVRRFGDLEVDAEAREVTVAGEPVALTRLEFDLLDALSGSPRTAFSRRQLLEAVWGQDWYGDDHVVDVHVSNLRRKIEPEPRAPRYVVTVRGIGYRMGPG